MTATLISSRAFFVDTSHGDALCPVCDIYNHKCAVIGENKNGDESDDDAVGPRAARCAGPELRAVALRLAETQKIDVELECHFDAGERSDDEEEEEEDEEEDEETKDDKFVTMITKSALKASSEVFNTYAEYGNHKLFLDFGFVVSNGNLFDTSTLAWEHIVEAAEEMVGTEQLEKGHFARVICSSHEMVFHCYDCSLCDVACALAPRCMCCSYCTAHTLLDCEIGQSFIGICPCNNSDMIICLSSLMPFQCLPLAENLWMQQVRSGHIQRDQLPSESHH